MRYVVSSGQISWNARQYAIVGIRSGNDIPHGGVIYPLAKWEFTGSLEEYFQRGPAVTMTCHGIVHNDGSLTAIGSNVSTNRKNYATKTRSL